ncbi:hypothetical protein HS125_14590 [bacterium]|nr:hypothetical protein [bacterium]
MGEWDVWDQGDLGAHTSGLSAALVLAGQPCLVVGGGAGDDAGRALLAAERERGRPGL